MATLESRLTAVVQAIGADVKALQASSLVGPAGPAGPAGATGETGPAGPVQITVSATAPVNPTLNQLWFDTSA